MRERLRAWGRSNFLRKVAGITVTRFGVMGLGFLTSILITRLLGAEGRGLYMTALTLGMIGAKFGNMGVATPNVYLVSRDRSLLPKVLGNSLFMGLGVGSLGALAAWGFFQAFPSLAPLSGWLLGLGLAWIPIWILFSLQENLLIGLHMVKAFSTAQLGSKVLQLGAVAALAWLLTPTPSLLLCGVLVVMAGSCLYQYGALRQECRVRPSFAPSLLRENFLFALRGQIAGLFALMVVKSDLLVVQYLLGPVQTGYYSVASSFADAIPVIPGVVAALLFPKISAMDALQERWRMSWRALKAVALFLAPCMVAAYFLAGPIIRFVYGEDFGPSTRSFQLLLPGLYFFALQSVATQVLRSAGHPMGLVWAWGACFLLNLGSNLYLIPRFGIEAAAMTSSFCYFFIFLLTWTMTRRLLKKGA